MCDEAPCSDWDVYFVVKAILDHCQEVEEMLRRERPRGKKELCYRISQGVNVHIFDAVFRTNHKLFCYNNNTIVPLTEP